MNLVLTLPDQTELDVEGTYEEVAALVDKVLGPAPYLRVPIQPFVAPVQVPAVNPSPPAVGTPDPVWPVSPYGPWPWSGITYTLP